MIFYIVAFALVITMCLALVRAVRGPGLYDRVLAVNMMGTKTVLLLAVIAYIMGRPDYIDLALAYALINFIGVFAVLEFFRTRESQLALTSSTTQSGQEKAMDEQGGQS